MLLPSALTCDTSQPRLQSALFISPPSSPQPFSTQSAIGNLINSCRNLHSLLSGPAPNTHLPSPPLANRPSPARRLRRREAKPAATGPIALGQSELPRYRIKKRAPPPRGVNKRRRAVEDDLGRSDNEDEDSDDDRAEEKNMNNHIFGEAQKSEDGGSPRVAPSTPKRQRIAPPDVPRGLTREDFHKIGMPPQQEGEERSVSQLGGMAMETGEQQQQRTGVQWSTEDDSKLVEIVLEKVKNLDLSNEVWEDCVRNLPGRDYNSVSSRWKSLIKSERIGLQNRGRSSRRNNRLHGTW
ncbi:hypothetical protein M406DRAFT_278665 [Cryphonectria parasitica EP155]|uniref:Myb-like domain-containing protein n=1 Tax=Cryphonectria parasitica (strain ATCC 38755 / EP155) TaxID=660469 RepID=A0A9P4Y0Y9_CRYP1|nr:uncharacterized protein M406DRAFT_278665 [Cryphonectria parasitica EP155]KAF3764977.1 hypothetical protein M406DRAFT_278665 [Cryphonectria parasitica EP155]